MQTEKEREFYIKKIIEYQSKTEDLINQVNSSGVTSELTHSSINDLLKEYNELEQEYLPLQEQLGNIKDLPANISLARVKLEEEKEKVRKLDNELTRKLTEMGMDDMYL